MLKREVVEKTAKGRGKGLLFIFRAANQSSGTKTALIQILKGEFIVSARMQLETLKWSEAATHANPEPVMEMEVQSLLRNFDHRNLVAPLREAQLGLSAGGNATPDAEQQRAALALQQQWDSWLAQREVLRCEIKRGRECLEHTHKELAGLRANLEDWALYERICGTNPLLEYMQLLSAKERIEQFLPDWLQRREAQLHALNHKMEQCAKQNGLEHLL